jgi:hypothetical protein
VGVLVLHSFCTVRGCPIGAPTIVGLVKDQELHHKYTYRARDPSILPHYLCLHIIGIAWNGFVELWNRGRGCRISTNDHHYLSCGLPR